MRAGGWTEDVRFEVGRSSTSGWVNSAAGKEDERSRVEKLEEAVVVGSEVEDWRSTVSSLSTVVELEGEATVWLIKSGALVVRFSKVSKVELT